MTQEANDPNKQNPPKVPSEFELVAKVMLAREARLAKKEEQEEAARLKREEQRDRNARSEYHDELAKQTTCPHLKGGKFRSRTQAKDYAVYMHTFINTERIIRCLLCKMAWKSKDTREHLNRNGKQRPNHTGISWDDALVMLGQSSNTATSSEVPMGAAPVVAVESEMA